MHIRTFHRILPVVLLGLGIQSALAANLHVIVLADTLDPLIGTGMDMENTRVWARRIADQTGLNLILRTLSGSDLTVNSARVMLSTLNVGGDDAIYFLYSGHGANLGGKWPTLTFISSWPSAFITFDEVEATLRAKGPRMLLVVADCCNAPLSSGRPIPRFEPGGQTALTTLNYQRLFLDFRGTILVSGCEVGQYSYGDPESGGLFTRTFMDNFEQLAASTEELTWAAVLSQTRSDVHDMTTAEAAQDPEAVVQTPQYEIEQVQGVPPAPQPDVPQAGQALPACGSMGAISFMLTVAGLVSRHRPAQLAR